MVISNDLFRRAREMVKVLAENRISVTFQHVLGHRGIVGNEEADKLAIRGAQMDKMRNRNGIIRILMTMSWPI